jgi:hypothetical protein
MAADNKTLVTPAFTVGAALAWDSVLAEGPVVVGDSVLAGGLAVVGDLVLAGGPALAGDPVSGVDIVSVLMLCFWTEKPLALHIPTKSEQNNGKPVSGMDGGREDKYEPSTKPCTSF